MVNRFILIVFVLIGGFNLQAQDKLVELSVRGTGLISTSTFTSDNYYDGFGYSVEVLYYFKPKLSLGIHYSSSLNYADGSPIGYSSILNSSSNQYTYLDGSFGFQQYGFSVKYTTNRARFFQAYLTARLVWQENVYNFQSDFGFSVGDEGMGAGIGGGVILRISPTFGFNLIEVNYNKYFSGFEFTEANFESADIQVKSGLVFNIRQRK
jgi:Outer membrane protein beta-barrel domain